VERCQYEGNDALDDFQLSSELVFDYQLHGRLQPVPGVQHRNDKPDLRQDRERIDGAAALCASCRDFATDVLRIPKCDEHLRRQQLVWMHWRIRRRDHL
jgi:hypothetical protein